MKYVVRLNVLFLLIFGFTCGRNGTVNDDHSHAAGSTDNDTSPPGTALTSTLTSTTCGASPGATENAGTADEDVTPVLANDTLSTVPPEP